MDEKRLLEKMRLIDALSSTKTGLTYVEDALRGRFEAEDEVRLCEMALDELTWCMGKTAEYLAAISKKGD